MNINDNRYDTQFGALYMPNRNVLLRQIGPHYAGQVENIRPQLIKIAQDVDIFIKPKNASKTQGSGFLVKITEALECPLKRLLGSDKGYVSAFASFDECFNSGKTMSSILLEKTIAAKENFLNYNQNPNY